VDWRVLLIGQLGLELIKSNHNWVSDCNCNCLSKACTLCTGYKIDMEISAS
jgi:hypothetical protein